MKRRTRWIGSILLVIALAIGTVALWISHDAACLPPEPLASGAATMQAIRLRCYGTTAILQPGTVTRPTPVEDELLVRVHAAGVNPLDWHELHGDPYIVRLSRGIGRPETPLAGVDFAGTVEAIGPDVREFRPGDAVFGGRSGAFGEYLLVRESRNVVRKPDNVTFAEAASVPIAATTALQALREAGALEPGQRVLINGASGGVGTFAVQIARGMGAPVTAVCSTRNADLVRSLGAHEVIDYTRADFTRGEARYDLVIDNVGNHPLSAYRGVLTEAGTVVMVTGPKENRWLGPAGRMLAAELTSGSTIRSRYSCSPSWNATISSCCATCSRPAACGPSSTGVSRV